MGQVYRKCTALSHKVNRWVLTAGYFVGVGHSLGGEVQASLVASEICLLEHNLGPLLHVTFSSFKSLCDVLLLIAS